MKGIQYFTSFILKFFQSNPKNCPLLQVEITAGPQLYVRTGSRLQLECLVTRAVEAPQWVMWQHGDTVTPGKEGVNNLPKNISQICPDRGLKWSKT